MAPAPEAVLAYFDALKAACVSLFASNGNTVVFEGLPDPRYYEVPEWVSLTDIASTSNFATIGTSRGHDQTTTITVWISVYGDGGEEQEPVCRKRAYQILGDIERHVRVTDPRLSGTVEWCILREHEMQRQNDEDLAQSGRFAEIRASFEASIRVRA